MAAAKCPSFKEREFLDLVYLIYDAAPEPRGWIAVLQKLYAVYNANCTTLFLQDFDNNLANMNQSVNVDPHYERMYEQYYGSVNIWFNKGREMFQPGRMLRSQQVLPDSELENSEYYNDFLRPQTFYHALGGVVLREGSTNSILTVTRSRSEDFGEEDLSFLNRLLPHLIRALQFHRRISALQSERNMMVSALDHFPQGVVLTDCSGKVLIANARAQQMLMLRDGLSIAGGVLQARKPDENASLRSLILGAAATGSRKGSDPGGYLNVSRVSAKRPFSLLVTPLAIGRFDVGTENAASAIFITDPEEIAVTGIDYLKSQYGLTASEAQLSASLCEGENLNEAAIRLHITYESARTRLKKIFHKTGTVRQSDLIRLLLTIPGPNLAP